MILAWYVVGARNTEFVVFKVGRLESALAVGPTPVKDRKRLATAPKQIEQFFDQPCPPGDRHTTTGFRDSAARPAMRPAPAKIATLLLSFRPDCKAQMNGAGVMRRPSGSLKASGFEAAYL